MAKNSPYMARITIAIRKSMCFKILPVFLCSIGAWAAEPIWKPLHMEYPERGLISEAPAAKWDDSLVTGNGNIGVSVPGNIAKDSVVLSHERLFLPVHKPMEPPALGPHLKDIRGLILEDKNIEAARFAWQLGQDMGYPPIWRTNPFVPVCVLNVELDNVTEPGNYARSVDFETGEVVVAWEQDGNVFHRRTFVSRPDGMAAMLITSPTRAKIDATFRMTQLPRPGKKQPKYNLDDVLGEVKCEAKAEWLTYSTQFKAQWPGALQGSAAAARLITPNGRQEAAKDAIHVTGADHVLILMDVEVFWDWPEGGVDVLKPDLKAVEDDYEHLLAQHAAVHGPMFRRARLELGAVAEQRLTVESLQEGSGVGALNPALAAKLFDAGRYNIICSTGELPPTLQGIWGATWYPPWSGDFTQDGNVQSAVHGGMSCNVPEATRAYLDYMTSLLEDFRANARGVFGCDGIWVPSRTSDHGRVYHFSERFPGLYWIAGAAWASQYYYDYWLYTGDKMFLKEQALPFMLESAAFYEDYLYLGENGEYIVNPSYSPEIEPAGQPPEAASTINATMDVASIKGLLRNLLALSAEIPLDAARVEQWRNMLAKMPDYQIESETGEFKEWCWPEYDNNNAHRHASHLYPLYFSEDPEISANPELVEACRKAIEARMAFRRNEKAGNVMAFGIVFKGLAAAHIKDKRLAYEAVDLLSNKFWTRGLVSTHNAGSGFNLDISGGMPALIAEMLMQSAPGRIELLPVLPEAWPNGRVQGLRARGGFELDIEWKDRQLDSVNIKSLLGKPCAIVYDSAVRNITLQQGESLRLEGKDTF